MMNKNLIIMLLIFLGFSATVKSQFVHPGILHTSQSLVRIKTMVAQEIEPWKSGYEIFKKDARASYDYKMNGPYEFVSRTGSKPGEANLHKKEFEDDCLAAYYNSMQWIITGEKKYATKSIEIMNGYSTTLKGIINKDKELMAPLCGFLITNAAEIIRYTDASWKPADVAVFEKMIKEVFYPVVENFATFANGNWDAACIKGMISFAVFLNDKVMYDKAVEYYYHGSGNGSITHYIINEAGQCQESGRDQEHTQFGLGCLAEACEVAYNQGVDLYGANDNRLLKGFEYTAKYNLGFDVPFQEWTDYTGKYHHTQIASGDRGHFRGVYEIVLNHYQKRKKIKTEYIQQAAEKNRPEVGPWTADHPGYGTLLFSLQ
jgi:Alginate lyase